MPVKVKRLWWKLAIGITIVFSAGCATGVIGTIVIAEKIKEKAEDQKVDHEMALNHLTKKLDLDDLQRAEVSEILEEMVADMVELRDDTRVELGLITDKYAPRIFAVLRPEQKSKFSEFLTKLGEQWKVVLQTISPDSAPPEVVPAQVPEDT